MQHLITSPHSSLLFFRLTSFVIFALLLPCVYEDLVWHCTAGATPHHPFCMFDSICARGFRLGFCLTVYAYIRRILSCKTLTSWGFFRTTLFVRFVNSARWKESRSLVYGTFCRDSFPLVGGRSISGNAHPRHQFRLECELTLLFMQGRYA